MTLSIFKGTVVALQVDGDNGLFSWTKLLTPNGTLDLNLTDSWFPEIKVGDLIECDSGVAIFENGRMVSHPEHEIIINDITYKEGR